MDLKLNHASVPTAVAALDNLDVVVIAMTAHFKLRGTVDLEA